MNYQYDLNVNIPCDNGTPLKHILSHLNGYSNCSTNFNLIFPFQSNYEKAHDLSNILKQDRNLVASIFFINCIAAYYIFLT